MSGPKYSTWDLEVQLRRQIRRERRMAQQSELRELAESCRKRLEEIEGEFGSDARRIVDRMGGWIAEAEKEIDGDLRLAWKGLHGVENYIERNLPALRADRERAEKIREEEMRSRALIGQMEGLIAECPEIVSEGVRQRMDLFSRALEVNPGNEQTLKQAEEFLDGMRDKLEEHRQREAERDHVRSVLGNVIGSGSTGPSGEGPLSGSIDGMPVEIRLESDKNGIRIDLPEGRDCRSALAALERGLSVKGVELGPVRIARTGQTWHARKTGVPNRRQRADA